MKMRVGFIGLGLMGRPMALRLLRAGYRVAAWNRTRSKAEAVAEEGAVVAATPRALAARSDVVITMVTGPTEVESLLTGEHGILSGLQSGATIIDMSTIGPSAVQRVAARCADHQIHLLDAPVTGSIVGAENGTLTVMVGGAADIYQRVLPVLQVFGQALYVGRQGMGAIVKLAQNLISLATVAALADGMALVEAHGLSPQILATVLAHTGVASPLLGQKAEAMLVGAFPPHFSLENMTKDIDLVLTEAKHLGLTLAAAQALQQLCHAGVTQGLGARDYSVLRQVQR